MPIFRSRTDLPPWPCDGLSSLYLTVFLPGYPGEQAAEFSSALASCVSVPCLPRARDLKQQQAERMTDVINHAQFVRLSLLQVGQGTLVQPNLGPIHGEVMPDRN